MQLGSSAKCIKDVLLFDDRVNRVDVHGPLAGGIGFEGILRLLRGAEVVETQLLDRERTNIQAFSLRRRLDVVLEAAVDGRELEEDDEGENVGRGQLSFKLNVTNDSAIPVIHESPQELFPNLDQSDEVSPLVSLSQLFDRRLLE